jgi:tRNA U38,U39,U40 pseudouridine synthase TruA
MFATIAKFFQKKKKSIEDEIAIPDVLILEDVTYENEVKKSKAKETKETKSTLTFGGK